MTSNLTTILYSYLQFMSNYCVKSWWQLEWFSTNIRPFLYR